MNVESLTLTSIGPTINHTIPLYEIKICPRINVQWPTCCLERQKRTTQRPSSAPISASTRKKSMRVKSLVCTTRWELLPWNQKSWKWLDRTCGGFFMFFLSYGCITPPMMFVRVAPSLKDSERTSQSLPAAFWEFGRHHSTMSSTIGNTTRKDDKEHSRQI